MQYEHLTDDEQREMYKNRIREIERSQFANSTELLEMRAIQKIAHPEEQAEADRKVAELERAIQYGSARLEALREQHARLVKQDDLSAEE